MKEIETERLLLRHIQPHDAADLYSYCKEPNVGLAAGWPPHASIDETKAFMEIIFLNQPNVFGMVLKENNLLIGSIGLIPDSRRQNPKSLMLGYSLSERYWGKGLMTEAVKAIIFQAFNELDITLISCTCYDSNIRSKRVIEKNALQYEGCLRQGELRYDGTMMNILCYSITKEEYEKHNKK